MSYSLDTSVCIPLIRGEDRRLIQKVTRMDPGNVGISVVVIFELFYGAARSRDFIGNRARLDQFLIPFAKLEFGQQDAEAAGLVRAGLAGRGAPIGPYDVLIAGQALAQDLTLVTANTKEFSRVDGLRLENWVAG